jgi:uncharacterized protein (TIRG00374 family)
MKKYINLFLSILITVLILGFLFTKANPFEAIDIVKNARIDYFLYGLAAYILLLIVKALRFKILLHEVKFTSLLPITFFYNFANNTLPMKLGELSFPYLIKKTAKRNFAHGFSSLIISRIFDFFTILITFVVAIIVSTSLPANYDLKFLMPILVAIILLIIVLIGILIFDNRLLLLFLKWLEKIPVWNSPRLIKFREFVSSLISSFSEFKSKRKILLVFLTSLISLVLAITSTIFFVYSLGYLLPVNILIITICFSMASSVIPISGIAGLGTIEGFWVLILTYLGYNSKDAIILAFSLHLMQIAIGAVLGLVGWVFVLKHFRKK